MEKVKVKAIYRVKSLNLNYKPGQWVTKKYLLRGCIKMTYPNMAPKLAQNLHNKQ